MVASARTGGRHHRYSPRMNSRSVGESSEFSPAENPSVVHDFGIGYIMIELASTGVPVTSPGAYRLKMLFSIVASSQLFGGCERSWMTAARFQWIGFSGFW